MSIFFKRLTIFGMLLYFTCALVLYYENFAISDISQVAYLDVGQGDSFLITTPSHKQLLIDGGRSSRILDLLENQMPYFDKKIDLIIGTHPDADHIGGLPNVLDVYDTGAVFEPGSFSDSKIYGNLEQSINENKIPHILARENMVIDFGDGTYFVFLFPNQDVHDWETNNSSIVGMYIHDSTSFLFTGDAPLATENYLVKKYGTDLHVDVLKLGHHGSRTSSGEEFLRTINPGLAIVSAGKENSYGHPHKDVVERLEKMKIPFFSTIDSGTINLFTNGKTISQNNR